MTPPHLLNILVHILAGSAAIVLGLYVLGKPKDAILHRRRGRVFADGATAGAAASVLYATLAAVGMLLAYDAARWIFPKRWHAVLWRYEHIYKILGCLFGMLSAAVGNTVRVGQPWSQLAPTVIGLATVVVCWVRTHRAQRRIDAAVYPAFRQAGQRE
jgi:hypothetical protein